MIRKWTGRPGGDPKPDKNRVANGFTPTDEANPRKSIQLSTTSVKKPKQRPSVKPSGQRQRETSTFSRLETSSSSPLYDGAATFSHFLPAQPSSASNSRRPSFHETPQQQYPSSPRPRTADAATFELARSRSQTNAASPATSIAPWADKPLPLLVDNDSARTQNPIPPYGDAMVDAHGRFMTAPPRPRTSSGVEAQPRRLRTDIIPTHTRPPYTLVPPIATNFDTRFSHVHHSPISRHSSRDNTPRGTPTSAKQPQPRNSILDEVEGSLTATLRDFQGLQEFLHHDSPPITPDQVYGPPPLYQPNDTGTLGARRSSGHSSHHPSDSYFSAQQPPPNWEASQMAAAIAQQHGGFPNGNGTMTMPLTPVRNGTPATGTLTGEYADYDPKLLAIQHAYEEQKKITHGLQLENNDLKRKQDFLRARLTEFENDKSTLKQNTKEWEAKIETIIVKLKQAKVGEATALKEIQEEKKKNAALEAKLDEAIRKNENLRIELESERETYEKVQAKLEEANTHKVDLQQAEFDNRKEIISTKKKLKKAVDELNAMKRKERNSAAESLSAAEAQKKLLEETQAQLEESRKQNVVLEEELKKLSPQSDLPSRVADMAFRIEGLESELTARETFISELKSKNANLTSDLKTLKTKPTSNNLINTNGAITNGVTVIVSPVSDSSSTASSPLPPLSPRPATEVEDMRRMMEVMDRNRRDAAADRDRLAALLFADLRRVAIEEHERRHPNQPFVYQKPELEAAVALVRERAHTYVKEQLRGTVGEASTATNGMNGGAVNGLPATNGAVNGVHPEDEEVLRQKIGNLEKEIDYYLNDIVLYKLDVRGYKKDLRRAEKRIKELNENGSASDSRSKPRSSSAAPSVDRTSPDRARQLLSVQ